MVYFVIDFISGQNIGHSYTSRDAAEAARKNLVVELAYDCLRVKAVEQAPEVA